MLNFCMRLCLCSQSGICYSSSMKSICLIGLAIISLISSLVIAKDSNPPNQLIDLHAHLFMKEGLTYIFHGDFFDKEIRSTKWSDLFSSQANPKTLNESGLGIVVVSLYAINGLLTPRGLKHSIREQIKQANRFVLENPQWIIARSPVEAREALQVGKRVLILSIEGISGIMDTNETIEEFYNLGVRIVTFLHLSDDRLGGAALLGDFLGTLSNLGANIGSKKEDCDGKSMHLNSEGLTQYGREIAQKLIHKGIWIDLSHSSDESQKELIEMIKKSSQPLLYTHTSLRKYYGVERVIRLSQLEEVKASGGIVGLLPTPKFLAGTPIAPEKEGSIEAFIIHYNEIADIIGSNATLLGSDFNAPVPHIKPPLERSETSLDDHGLFNIGQMQEFWNVLGKRGARIPKTEEAIDYFLKAWEKVSTK